MYMYREDVVDRDGQFDGTKLLRKCAIDIAGGSSLKKKNARITVRSVLKKLPR